MGGRAFALVALGALSFGCSGGDGDRGVLAPQVPSLSGLDARPVNPACTAPPRDAVAARVAAPRAFPRLEFESPVGLVRAPGDATRWFVVEQAGRIRVFDSRPTAAVARVFADLSGKARPGSEFRLAGLAFHPEFTANGRAYVSYARYAGGSWRSIVSELTSADGGHTLDAASERVLLAVDRPSPPSNDGRIAFGPEGDLYVGVAGDGGAGEGAQNVSTSGGSVLHIDVDAPPCHRSTPDGGGCPKPRATGLANPNGWAFDSQTGELRVADAAGGHVYRGRRAPALSGHYVYGDARGMISASRAGGSAASRAVTLLPAGATPQGAPGPLQVSGFAEGEDGELYVLDQGRGHIRRLVFAEVHSGDNVPHVLSETGCINTAAAGAPPLLNLIPFRPNAALWSDGAAKDRWISLPDGRAITAQADGDWDLPEGTVLVKHFRVGERLVETRLFMRHPDGAWAGYTYQWNPEQTEALRVSDGLTKDIDGLPYTFPSEADCLWCHNDAAGFTLGPETAQLNGKLLYPQTGREANQLATLNAIGALSPPIRDYPPAYADHTNAGESLEARARAYLHINCSICHRPGGPTPAGIDLRHDTPLAATGACDAIPSLGDLGIPDARIIAPGDSARSELLSRMARRDDFRMPPLASNVADPDGVALVAAWIDSLGEASCR